MDGSSTFAQKDLYYGEFGDIVCARIVGTSARKVVVGLRKQYSSSLAAAEVNRVSCTSSQYTVHTHTHTHTHAHTPVSYTHLTLPTTAEV